MPSDRTVLLLGATGLVGGHALSFLASDPTWNRVVTLGRRGMDLASPTHEHHVVDFSRLGEYREQARCDTLAICLGTTIKTAGSQEAFRRVDLEIPLEAATLARDAGASRVALVSAYGADAGSRIFYNRVKGEAEDAIRDLGFESTTVLRPSLLDGDRGESRPGERIGLAVLGTLAPVLLGPLRPLRPTPARDVGAALAQSLREGTPGVTVLEPGAIRAMAAEHT